ncbi:MAG: cation:proton antiporter [Candidatus Delongbacteria bacterium]|nr:cation:proton antiporter [Candidatus Delongbacteria bacterium]
MRILLLFGLFAMMILLQNLGFVTVNNVTARSLMIFGFLILTGTVAGALVLRLRLPGITGYLLAGVICGPDLLHLVQGDVLANLSFINETALTFIALLAGAELRLLMLRQRLRGISWIVLMQSIPGILLVSALFLPLFLYLPALQGYTTAQLAVMALLLGIIAVAVSPSTTVAVMVEARAQGPVKDTVLGVTMVLDVVVILLFTLTVALVAPLLASGAESPHLTGLLLEMGFSMLGGLLTGVIGILILHFITTHRNLVMLGLGLLIVELARDFHLDPLLIAISCGFLIANFSRYGSVFQETIEKVSLPLFLVFFALAGAGLDFTRLAATWPLALLLVVSRLAVKFITSRWGVRAGGLEPQVLQYAWMGFIGQAGVSLGFVLLLEEQFPAAGGFLKQIIIAAIVINQIIGPIMLQYAFDRSGETGVAMK